MQRERAITLCEVSISDRNWNLAPATTSDKMFALNVKYGALPRLSEEN